MYFSDIYADRPVSQEARSNKILHGTIIKSLLIVVYVIAWQV